MILDLLSSSPMLFVAWVVAIIIAITVHEFSHVWCANLQGDNTGKDLGRLNLNPLSHLSGLGFIMLLIVGFGWGKPAPFNPYNLRYKRWGSALVAMAGPVSNLVLAVFSGIILRLLLAYSSLPPENLLIQFLNLFVILNVVLLTFNLIPIPPLDGSKILFGFLHSPKYKRIVDFLDNRGPFLLIFLLIIDSMLPISIFGGLFQFIINIVYGIIF